MNELYKKKWDAGKKTRGFPVNEAERSVGVVNDRGIPCFICRRWDPLFLWYYNQCIKLLIL